MGKPLKETGFGKILWGAGDALKGKGKIGKVLDSVLEIAPIPNPIRITKEITQQKSLKKLASSQAVQNAAREKGVDMSDLLDDQPSWVFPALATLALGGALYLVATGAVDPQIFVEIAKTIF